MTATQGEEHKIERIKESFKGLLFFNIVGFFVLIHTTLDYRLLKVGAEKIIEYQVPSEVQYQYVPKNGRKSAYVAILSNQGNDQALLTELSCWDYTSGVCSLFEDTSNQFKTIKLLTRFYPDSPEKIRDYIFMDATYFDENGEPQTVIFNMSAYEKANYTDYIKTTLLKYSAYFSLLLGFLFLVFFVYSFDSEKVTPYMRLQKRDLNAEFTKYRKMMLHVLLANIAIVWIFTTVALKI